jgi:DNA-binding NarL/FixJ family response regulator
MTATGSLVLERLTPRQRQILAMVCDGMANKDIAAELGIRHQVVKNYLRAILTAAGMCTRTELVVFAFSHRIVECPCRRTPEIQPLPRCDTR